MKDLNNFLEDLCNDKDLEKTFAGINDVEKVSNLAKEYGYNFTQDELMDTYLELVSGGVGSLFNIETIIAKITMKINGSGNTQINFGDIETKKNN